MKNIYTIPLLLLAFILGSCSEDKLSNVSVIVDPVEEPNEFDTWILGNYTNVYNIDVKYRIEDIEADMNYNLVPADLTKSVTITQLVKYLCLEAYDTVTGSPEFIKSYFPKILSLIGSPAYKNNGSMVLGTAEGGQKITLYNVNLLNMKDVEQLNEWYFRTIHHEFAHILHQTIPYTSAFEEISGANYITDNWSGLSEEDALQKGFITPYASSAVSEDFVELISVFATISPEQWEAKLALAEEEKSPGRKIIEAKFAIVKNYLSESWNIDLEALRSEIAQRIEKMDQYDFTELQK